MRKLSLALALLILVPVSMVPAHAATKSAVLTKAFQKYLTDGEAEYAKAIMDAKALYEPQISTAESKLLAAQSQFALYNQVNILKTTTHSPSGAIAIDAVNCPATRSDCKDPSYKSNEFKAGEVATVYSFTGGDAAFLNSSYAQMNMGLLQTVDLQIKDGLISLVNSAGYNGAVSAIRTQYQNVQNLTQQYAQAKSDAETKLQDVQRMKSFITSAIISTKRANLNSGTFEKAFVSSFKFEYNAKRLDELARAPWTYISSLKALKDAVSVTRQSELADSISNNYSLKAASGLNSTYGNLFLSEQEYKDGFHLVSEIYRTASGVTLKG